MKDNDKRGLCLSRLCKRLEKYKHRNIAFYGIGNHTKLLLDLLDFSAFNIIGLIDSKKNDSRQNKYGYTIFSLEELLDKVEVIVISSDTFQEVIYERIKHVEQIGIDVIRIYSTEIYSDLLTIEEDCLQEKKAVTYSYNGAAEIVGIGFTYRTIDNYVPVLDKFRDNGFAVNLVLFPNQEDDNHQKIYDINYHIFADYPIELLNSLDELPFRALFEIIKKVCMDLKPNVLIIDDINSYPSNGVKKAVDLLDIDSKPIVVCFQHGFYQNWQKYNANFACDYFFCFGDKHKAEFKKVYDNKVFATGLPKFDRLRSVHTTDERYILFATQCEWSMCSPRDGSKDIFSILLELSNIFKLPVKIKPHPQYDDIPQHVRDAFEILNPQSDGVNAVAQATYVITTGSTIAIESLILGKNTVILPSNTGTAYLGCPALVASYDTECIVKALNEFNDKKQSIHIYLDQVVSNWRNFNTSNAAYKLIKSLYENNHND